MADAVFSVRIEEELKNRFLELAQQNGINNKDLMQMMLTQFELGQISTGSDQFTQDIDELQRLTKRMADIYINMVERVQLRELENKNKENQQLYQQEEEIARLKEQLLQLEEKERQIQQLKDQVKGLKQEVGLQKEEQRNLKDLNDLLREKNSELEKRFVEVEVKIETANSALEELTKLRALIEDKEDEVRRLSSRIRVIEDEKEEQKDKFLEKMNQNQVAMEQEFELLKRKQTLELQELRLLLQQEHGEKVEKLKEGYEAKVMSLVEENEGLKKRLDEQLSKGEESAV
ncbi:MAG: hypothetical protein Q4Q00_12605 [Turicibacter sp.]|nr:hypothetical protein [Turicibacter sp.]